MPSRFQVADALVRRSRALARDLDRLRFGKPVDVVYDPLTYAFDPFEQYLRRYATRTKRVLFVGMNPGPYGMLQTGVPFGEVDAVRRWLRIEGKVGRPARLHAKRPVQGYACARSEVSGRRLWGLFEARFGDAERFFRDHLVWNYCPLAFFDAAGRNVTPDKLAARDRARLAEVCDASLREVARLLRPRWLVGIGAFAAARAEEAAREIGARAGRILHPSPASPAANKDWAGRATRELEQQGVW